jgi:hypothetical protein
MIQEADIMGMEQGITLHLKHSMTWVLIHLLVVLVVGVGAMVGPEFVLIVLLSMKVLGRTVTSVDYLLVDKHEKSHRTQYEVKYGRTYMYINMHTS